jgi:hypothetical protein
VRNPSRRTKGTFSSNLGPMVGLTPFQSADARLRRDMGGSNLDVLDAFAAQAVVQVRS